ncbi:MAG TPA: hypothetical protein VNF48_00530 [Gammaproteobacteria bacterium]|nr:hypothetical protein [Gammaproteobacteria bacterium]
MSQQVAFKRKYVVDVDDAHVPDTGLASIPVKVSNSLTPAQASKRWCPFVRIREYQEGAMEGTAVNRSFDSADSAANGSLCLASGCMAWRWDLGHDWEDEERRDEPRGSCGLAGHPNPS